jgi:hypothetical protein
MDWDTVDHDALAAAADLRRKHERENPSAQKKRYEVWLTTRFDKKFIVEAESPEEAEAKLREATFGDAAERIWDTDLVYDAVTSDITGAGAWGPADGADDEFWTNPEEV